MNDAFTQTCLDTFSDESEIIDFRIHPFGSSAASRAWPTYSLTLITRRLLKACTSISED